MPTDSVAPFARVAPAPPPPACIVEAAYHGQFSFSLTLGGVAGAEPPAERVRRDIGAAVGEGFPLDPPVSI